MKTHLYPKTISACGCLFYKKTTKELLLISYTDPNWEKYDDFGGMVDNNDESVYETIWREVEEETNGIINKNEMQKILKSKQYTQFYTEFCKYFFIAVNVEENYNVDTHAFGTIEKTDQILRTINWIKYEEALKNLAVRLQKCDKLINFLNNEFSIKSKNCFSKIYF